MSHGIEPTEKSLKATDEIIDEKSGNVNKKPTINQLRKENGLSEIPDGDIALRLF